MDFVAYAPAILNEFVVIDRVKNLGEALAPIANYQEILNDCVNS